MTKRGQAVRSPTRPTASTKRKRAPADVDLKKENATLRRELTEALERQNATSEVLQVISSTPGELEPVFQKMLENATRVCGANFGTMNLYDGDRFKIVALYNVPPAFAASRENMVIHPHPESGLGTVARTHQVVHIHDLRKSLAYLAGNPAVVGITDVAGARTIVIVPMLKEERLIGTIAIYRKEVRPFTDRQIALVENFTRQAVIAIENARLLRELRERTADLTESLQQQTATADVLKVISRSAFDLQTVFDTLISSAVELIGASAGTICLRKGDGYRYLATSNMEDGFRRFLLSHPPTPGRASAAGRVLLSANVESIPDVLEDPDYRLPAYELNKTRSVVGVPLLRNDNVEGALVLNRTEPGLFTARQIELVQTFADQAVIAIENARLFDEVQARTEDLRESLRQQTATADVLKVISRSTFNLQAVLQTLVESAARLCEADKAAITRQKEGVFCRAENFGFSQEFMDYVRGVPVEPERGSAQGRALLKGLPVHIPDAQADPNYTFTEGQRLGDFRTVLAVPMLREGTSVGVLALTRSIVRPFTDKQIELVTTFADQAAIAIENVRLFDEVQARTRQLAASLDDLRAAQDRLVQTEKLASLGHLTAGIAHEIKNPLNFVNNFALLSAELTDELNDVLKSAALAEKTREEVGELTGMLKENLGKVVQHGKRADSIVKNMLLHSREGSGEHRPADINALLDESLNLAYHGARADKPQFNVTLQRDFDEAAGTIDVFPQEITRVFVNLISNGFYAVTKRKTENGDSGFEPTVSATTRNLGHAVEIRIRDNGTGIPGEVKEKMFNPFFTTKPAGEGTGLGLSISYDIVVKQHGGIIDVDTAPGAFTEFRIVLPRAGASLVKTGEDK